MRPKIAEQMYIRCAANIATFICHFIVFSAPKNS